MSSSPAPAAPAANAAMEQHDEIQPQLRGSIGGGEPQPHGAAAHGGATARANGGKKERKRARSLQGGGGARAAKKGSDRTRSGARKADGGVVTDRRGDRFEALPYHHVVSGMRESRKRRTLLQHKADERARDAARHTASTDILKTDVPGGLRPDSAFEKTFHVRQADIVAGADLATTAKAAFHLDLADSNLSPYVRATYSRSGRALLVASRRGHVALADWRAAKLGCELHLNETVRDATFLHNDSFFATAQKAHVYIYDASGAQIHALRTHRDPGALAFLPHHLLLASASAPAASHAELVYTDTSVGAVAARLDFGVRALALGACNAAAHNRANGVVALAHARGAVSLWSPASGRPLARIFLHAGGARCVDVTHDGTQLVTAGADGELAVTDLRKYDTVLRQRLPATPTALSVSQRGLIATSFGASVQVWRTRRARSGNGLDAETPYMTQTFSGQPVTALHFCPFEDVLAVCREHGMRSMLVPGAGEPTFDSHAPNPYDSRAQKREREVHNLLDKLPPESIVLDADTIGNLDVDPAARRDAADRLQGEARVEQLRSHRERDRKRGRNKISKRLIRKQNKRAEISRIEGKGASAARDETMKLAKKISFRQRRDAAAGLAPGGLGANDLPDALKRFMPKS